MFKDNTIDGILFQTDTWTPLLLKAKIVWNRLMKNTDSLIQLSVEVQNGLENNLPIVCLESTVISHGLPYPDNLITIQSMQDVIRSVGVIPVVIGIVNGKIKIGLSDEEITLFSNDSKNVMKVNQAEIPYCLTKKLNGATTVSATAFCAAQVGIRIFATGGIGGVHRDVNDTLDISSDLYELSKIPTLVVCAGAKAILDIPRTLEYLETLSVPVVGYKTAYFPLFYSASSSYKLSQTVDSIEEAAKLAHLHFNLQNGGMIIAQPIPIESSLNAEIIEEAILVATKDCNAKGIKGKEVTPYILARLTELTHGKTLAANKELLVNNARLAAQISFELSHGHPT